MCVDSLGLGYVAPHVSESEIQHFKQACRGPVDVLVTPWQEDRHELIPVKWTGEIPGLGRLSLNADGYVQFHQRSLQKIHQELILSIPKDYCSNTEVLTHKKANETFQYLTEKIEFMLPFVDRNSLSCHRVDLVFQRAVKSSMATIKALQGAIKPTRGGCSWFDNSKGQPTGIMLMGKAVAHRVYDKGLESLDEKFINVLRSEEQLRTKSVGLSRVVDCQLRTFDKIAAIDIINERYLDVGYGDQLDVTPLIRDAKDTLALLVLHPELIEEYRSRVKINGFNKMKRKIREYRAAAIPDDMRVPSDAWDEPSFFVL